MPEALPHHMLREIYDQPRALAATLASFPPDAFPALTTCPLLLIVASGSSRHAGLVAKFFFEELAHLPTVVDYSSEYLYRTPSGNHPATVLVLSQSGETADTLEALREAHARGAQTCAITNHADSSMPRLAGHALTTPAGPELAIPATKSFTTQLLTLYLLALQAAVARGHLSPAAHNQTLAQLARLPDLIEQALPAWKRDATAFAATLARAESCLFVGRALHFPIAQEGALKLKESACLPAEAYPAGELKHGPAALLSPTVPLVALAAVDHTNPASRKRYEKTAALLAEMHQRGVSLFALASAGDTTIPRFATTIHLPRAPEHQLPLLEIIPLQLLAYATATRRGLDADHPRNLNKAVLVE